MRLLQYFGANRIATQVWLLLALVYLASAIFITVLLFRGFQSDVLGAAQTDIEHRVELACQEQLQNLSAVKQHVAVLSRAPQVERFSDSLASGSSSMQDLRIQTEQLFVAFLETYPEYFQVRLLDGATGKEQVRAQKTKGGIQIVAPTKLQSKGERPYFKETVQLSPGEFYFSQFDLNQEHGKFSIPYIKTVRVATPIANAGGTVSSVLVINVDASLWFERIATYSLQHDSIFLMDAQGDFLFHPADQRTFASLKGDSEPTELEQALLELKPDENGFGSITLGGFPYLTFNRPFDYGSHPARQLHMVMTVRKGALFEGGREQVRTTFYGTVVALALGLLLLLWMSKSVVRPIRQLDEDINAFVPGGQIPDFDVARKDELGSLARTFSMLAARINEQIEELREAQSAAENSAAEKEAFLGNFSHELRTPLNSIAGMTEVLHYSAHSPEQKPVIETLKYSVENLSALISDVLDYNRILEGNLQLSPSEVLPEEIARNMCMALDIKAKGANNSLTYRVAPNVPVRIITDKVRLMQIVNNLLNNALKFTQNGTVHLSIDWEDNMLIVQVADTGMGMRDAELRQIFNRYQQAEGGRKSKSGLGLGLAIVKHLVALFGGNIEVASEYGKGSEFLVRLPAKAATDTTPQKASETLLGSHLSVLYVDDVAVNRITMEHFLLPAGVQLVCVESCKDALVEIEQGSFDVILMDLRMPEMDGFECITCVRKSLPRVPIIAVSANLADEETNRLAALGIRYSIEKPVDPRQLFARILEVTSQETSAVYKQLMTEYCNNDQALLGRILEQFRVLLDQCSAELDANISDDQADKILAVKDIRHKLHPSVAMFGQTDQVQAICDAHSNPIQAQHAVIAHLRAYLDQFETEQLGS